MKRRDFLSALAAFAVEVKYPAVDPGRRLSFPRDHGAHPEFRTEWWYATGWLSAASREPLGFQVTFFRSRPPFDSANPSSFAARQVLFAHAALADPKLGRLRHDQRAARAALGVAGASDETTAIWIDDWRLALEGDVYQTRIVARNFRLQLDFAAAAPPLAQGEGGFSRKGVRAEEASYYYSRPQLAVRGSVDRGAGSEAVTGIAWLDHEWSSSYLPREAVGWDWVGLNLANGGALMAFRMRDRQNGTLYAPPGVSFTPLRTWRSPRTGVDYPVAMRVIVADKSYVLDPLMDDQELDARASVGTIYWEGAVRALAGGAEAGRGYLELTGYWKPMKL